MRIKLISALAIILVSESLMAKENCRWLGKSGTKKYETSPEVSKNCDNESFKELSYYLAKDKTSVYCKPMPNAHNYAVIIKGADAGSIEMVNKEYLAKDTKCVYQYCQVIKGLDGKTFDIKKFNSNTSNDKLVDSCE